MGNVVSAAESLPVLGPIVVKPVVAPVKCVIKVANGGNVAEAVVGAVADVASPLVTPALAPVNLIVEVIQGRNLADAAVDAVISASVIGGPIRDAVKRGRGERVLIIDATDGRGFLGVTWDAASIYSNNSGRFGHVIHGKSWEQVAQSLLEIYRSDGPIYEVQMWMHGSPGCAYLGSECLSVSNLATPEFQSIRGIFTDNGKLWFRTCSTMNGNEGRAFATAVSDHFGGHVTVAGHTVGIDAIHGGLVSKKPGQAADWKDGSGSFCLCTDMSHHDIGN